MSSLSPHGAEALDTSSLWWALWHEPWIGMHPAWSAYGDAAAWPVVPGAVPASRLMYRGFCRRWDVDALAPFPSSRLDAELARLPIDAQTLSRAALAIGRVGYVSHSLATSRHQLAHLFDDSSTDGASDAAADADAWTTALRNARARPLTHASLAPPEGREAPLLQRWAFPLMARLVDEALPGAWSRLRLRLDPSLVRTVVAQVGPPPAMVRQTLRLWRSAAPAPAPASAPKSAPTESLLARPA